MLKNGVKHKERLLLWFSRLILMIPFLVIGGPLFFLGGIVMSNTLENNRILHNYEAAFNQLSHPDDTSRIYALSDVRRAPSNGDSCFYFVGQLREFSGSPKHIENFYSPNNLSETFANGEFNVEFLGKGQFSIRVPYGLNNLSEWPVEEDKVVDRNIYLIYWLIPDYLGQNASNRLDLRCQ